MNPLNRMNSSPVPCCIAHPRSYGEGSEHADDCMGVSAYPPELAANSLYGKRDQAYTGNGYGAKINPLLEEPATVDEYVSLIRARGASLERWTHKNAKLAADGSKVREIIARMEGDLRGLRTLIKDIEEAALTSEASKTLEILARIADAK